MKKLKTIFCFMSLAFVCTFSSSLNKSLIIKNPSRHLVVQLGITGRKPWHHLASYHTKAHFRSAVFDQLLHIDRSYKISPGLILDWKWVEKSKSYIFTIDRSQRFDSSRILKVEDIEFALVKNFISNHPNSDKRLYTEIKGTDKLKIGQKFKSGMCDGIKKLDDSRLEIVLSQSNPTFLYTMGAMSTFIAPIEDFKDDYFTFKGIPRGTGPYKIAWSSPNDSQVRLERKKINKEIIDSTRYPLSIDIYDHGEAKLRKVDLAAGAGTNGLEEEDGYEFVANSIPTIVQMLDFNFDNQYGQNKKFRKAVSLAINRKEIFKGYKNTTEVHELVPTGYYGRSNGKFEHNPEKAKKIVKSHFLNSFSPKKPLLGFFHGKKGNKKLPKYIKAIQKQLSDVGIYIDFIGSEIVPFKSLPQNYVMGSFGNITSFVDPLAPFSMYLVEGSDLVGNADQSDQKAKDLYKKAAKATTQEERAKFISQLSSHFQKNFIALPLEQRGSFFAYNVDTIEPLNEQNTFFAINYDLIKMKKKK